MTDLLTIDKVTQEPLLDSRVAADVLGVSHQSIRELIESYSDRLGSIRFETGSKKSANGRINPKPERWALLSERQALLVLTMVRNTTESLTQKEKLVDAFLALREAAMAGRVAKAIRKEFTDEIQEAVTRGLLAMHGHEYSLFTDLIYRVVVGQSSKQFREAHDIPARQTIRPYLTQDQASRVAQLEKMVGSMVQAGFDYQQIKDILASRAVIAGQGEKQEVLK